MDWNGTKIFCFTGKLNLFTRYEARSYAQKAGYKWSTDVNRDVDYLVMADPNSTSAKAKKARALGITLLSEQEFMDMVSVTKENVVEKKAKALIAKSKKPATWKKCFKCVLKNLGLKSHETWNDYDYDKMEKSNFVVEIYFLVNADVPDASKREVVLASSRYVYGVCNSWYGPQTIGWRYDTTSDPEVAYERVLQHLLNPRDDECREGKQTYRERQMSTIKNFSSPKSKLVVPNIPNVDFSSPDELQLILASYGWNVEFDDE